MNTGWMYYKGIYRGIEKKLLLYHIAMKQAGDSEDREKKKPEKTSSLEKEMKEYIQKENKRLLDKKINISMIIPPWETLSGITSPSLTTTYPGLAAGTGYEHEAGIEGEFKTGFSFDHTTGLPILPGSSVKGILRNSFNHTEYIKEKLGGDYPSEKIELLKKWIFEGIMDGKPVSIYKRIIFFDAVIIPGKDDLFDEDYLSPHTSMFSEPIPIKFLRVMPGSRITFGFKIPEKTILSPGFIINASRVRDLFKKIILDTGVGAMTCYGYGHLIDPNSR
ncbi:MAG: type III-B CRISPR module RAMP protein Cmr6 [Spirochaetales bacterium]|nr:type III-B CRISPR module RAMP protein Cmr6 [Spirochaetales bacterium]